MTTITTRDTCRACAAAMRDILSLGDIVPVDFIQPGADVRPAAPLTLAQCVACGLVQLRHTVAADSLYRQYWYQSGLNPTMIKALQDVVDGVNQRIVLQPADVVVDIGANDGTLLRMWQEELFTIGVDPARNLLESARDACDAFINDYFETSTEFDNTIASTAKAKVITSIAMFYDLDEPARFVQKIVDTLRVDGVWVMQMTDLVRMLRSNAFDNICHEHLCYYPLQVFCDLVAQHSLEVFDVETNDVNGASVRCYVGHKGAHPIAATVKEMLADEHAYLQPGSIDEFGQRVEQAKAEAVAFIRRERAAGKTFHVMGASTKGNTLLQYYGLTHEDVVMAAEVNVDKYGLVMAGSGVPICSQQDSLDAKPDYYLVLPWHFIDFLVRKHEAYLAEGGGLYVPLPEPKLYAHGT